MKRLMNVMAILLICSMVAHADETITVSATNGDIAANLDLKVVAKLFGEAKDLEDFEARLNNPDSAFVNLDLNGDGDVDYIRVIETTNGNKHLIVLQAVLAKDIYQDVASIYVEKDEANNVSVQVIGEEYIYGENYVIEPVYIYRPVIYDWFWGAAWVCWNSPWYWGYYPYWWHPWSCVHYWTYWDHCHHFHHHHHGCSFHYAREARPSSRSMRDEVRRDDYAKANPGQSFRERNTNIRNARELPAASSRVVAPRSGEVVASRETVTRVDNGTRPAADRSYGSSYTSQSTRTSDAPKTTRSSEVVTSRADASVTSTRSSSSTQSSGSSSQQRGSTATQSRPTPSTSVSSTRTTTVTNTRPASSSQSQSSYRPTSSSSSSQSTYRPSSSSSSSSSRPTSTSSGSSSRPSSGSMPSTSRSSGSAPSSRPSGGASPRR